MIIGSKESSNEKEMMISVVIPLYNAEASIAKAVESVVSQTSSLMIREIIIVNDGSTDSSHEQALSIARQTKGIPIKVIDQQNQGAASARNTGIIEAKSEWIALLDADDVWKPSKIEIQLSYLEKHPDMHFIGSNHQDKPLRILCKRITAFHRITLKELCVKWYPVTPTFLFSKEMFNAIGGFDSSMRYAEDGEFLTRAVVRGYKVCYSPENVVSIGHGKRSFGQSGLSANLTGMYEGNRAIFRKLHLGSVYTRNMI